MDVLKEILKWSEDKPIWQKDALRRLVTKVTLDDTDYKELLTICKAVHGLSDSIDAEPLTEQHIPSRVNTSKTTVLKSLTHHEGVNALANNQTIEFGPMLTIVYGQNAAGKSGYTRVLKRACRARGSEVVLSNVLTDNIPPKPSVSLSFEVDGSSFTWNWTEVKDEGSLLGNVSVFDRHCATVYLDEKTDVAFRPFGLDLFDKLAICCEKLKGVLEKERSAISSKIYNTNIFQDTAAFKMTENLTSLTDLEVLKNFSSLSVEEKQTQADLRLLIRDLSTENPEKIKKSLSLKYERIKSFKSKTQLLFELVSTSNINLLKALRVDLLKKDQMVSALRKKIEEVSHLRSIGSEHWMEMWNASGQFSQLVYPGHTFPLLEEKARCVLCQQHFDEVSKIRMTAFKGFMASSSQQELNEQKKKVEEQVQRLKLSRSENLSSSGALSEIEIENHITSETIKNEILTSEEIIDSLISGLSGNSNIDEVHGLDTNVISSVEEIERSLHARLSTFPKSSNDGEVSRLTKSLREFDARETLEKEIPEVTREIDRKKRFAAYGICLDDVSTNLITRKSTEITKKCVTDQLATSFQDELKKLGFGNFEIELAPSGGSRGTLYHKILIKRATSVRVQDVVSEGEGRTLSIAAFFSELSTSTNSSAILFDDPVSSLDHIWRDKVAARLVEESQKRQTIVFTHDVVFLNSLKGFAEKRGVNCMHQYIHREFQGAGVTSASLPWVALKIKDRIGALNKLWQEADKIQRTQTKDEYDQKAITIYGYLREAWERGLEEVLINGTVERYRPSIQTQQIKNLADITDEDCNVFYEAMTKCSRWLPGHDNAPAENFPVPDSSELKTDISTLENWVKNILTRRK